MFGRLGVHHGLEKLVILFLVICLLRLVFQADANGYINLFFFLYMLLWASTE